MDGEEGLDESFFMTVSSLPHCCSSRWTHERPAPEEPAYGERGGMVDGAWLATVRGHGTPGTRQSAASHHSLVSPPVHGIDSMDWPSAVPASADDDTGTSWLVQRAWPEKTPGEFVLEVRTPEVPGVRGAYLRHGQFELIPL